MKMIKVTATGESSALSEALPPCALYAVQFVDGNLSDGVDATLTAEQGDLSIPLLVKENFNTDSMYYPRVAENLNTDGSALTNYTMPVVAGKLKVLFANGGTGNSGSVIFYLIEL